MFSPISWNSVTGTSTVNRHMGFLLGAAFDYKLSKRFGFAFNYKISGNTKVGTAYVAASIIVPAGGDKTSIVSRDNNGDINVNIMNGTATAARYADLAEKYLADVEYEVGTVVVIGGEKEVTACTWGNRAIGVVSNNPAFMMNKDLEGGTYIALKGRVPVKVIGRIKKGDELIASNNGCAEMAVPHSSKVFAIALETNDSEEIKFVECLIL